MPDHTGEDDFVETDRRFYAATASSLTYRLRRKASNLKYSEAIINLAPRPADVAEYTSLRSEWRTICGLKNEKEGKDQ